MWGWKLFHKIDPKIDATIYQKNIYHETLISSPDQTTKFREAHVKLSTPETNDQIKYESKRLN